MAGGGASPPSSSPPPPPSPTSTKLWFSRLIDHLPVLLLILLPSLAGVALLRSRITAGLHDNLLHLLLSFFVVLFVSVYFFFVSRQRPVLLLDYTCYRSPGGCRVPSAGFLEHAKLNYQLDVKTMGFLERILQQSGLGEETCLPPGLHYIPQLTNMSGGRAEAELVIFTIVDELLGKTGVQPKDLDILIVNCSLFAPTPSLSAMVVNRYKMRSNIKSFNLSGMGCSASIVSIHLARDLLKANPNSRALVISTEILSPNIYKGSQRSMWLSNCLFRMGCAAILLSNMRSDRRKAKYTLAHVVRTHKGADDLSHRCVYQEEDKDGKLGVALSKDVMVVAGEALKSNITTIGPLVLPVSEQLLFLSTLLWRKFVNPKWKPYIPDFKQAFEHFCIHAGGRGVIDELQKNLRLSDQHVEASRMTLYRFGNTSSSSLWYELSYIESKGRMKKGDRVWQIAFGSGFKCNSAVWKCNKTVTPRAPLDGPWADCIDNYPVDKLFHGGG